MPSHDENFKLCNDTFLKIVHAHGNWLDVAKYDRFERTVALIWQSFGVIGNGGFKYLFAGNFDGDPGFRLTVAAYRQIGATAAATAFERAIALFPDKTLPDNLERRNLIYGMQTERKRDDIDSQYFNADEEIIQILAAFIREDEAGFDPIGLQTGQR